MQITGFSSQAAVCPTSIALCGETVAFRAPLLGTANSRDLRSTFFDVQERLTRERPGEVGSQL